MSLKSIITGYACGLGARDQRTQSGPESIRRYLNNELNQINFNWGKTICYDNPNEDVFGLNAMEAVAKCCSDLSKEVSSIIEDGKFPIVVGGDHSSAIGTWSGVVSATRHIGELGLIWIDAHMDGHTKQTSHSGFIHGMPVAALLGKGDDSLTKIGDSVAKIRAENIYMIGVRDYEPEEQALLEMSGAHIYYIEDVQKRGFASIFAEVIAEVKKTCALFGLSVDIDGLCPLDAPGTGYRIDNGIKANELLKCLETISHEPKFCALEIAEFNPHFDENDKTLDIIKKMILSRIHIHSENELLTTI